MCSTALLNHCNTILDYEVPKIGPGFHYDPSHDPSECECSTVMYNLYSAYPTFSIFTERYTYDIYNEDACALCQDGTNGPWTEYKENCTSSNKDGT